MNIPFSFEQWRDQEGFPVTSTQEPLWRKCWEVAQAALLDRRAESTTYTAEEVREEATLQSSIPCGDIAEGMLRAYAADLERRAEGVTDVPLGAIENGRVFADRLESTGLECDAGNLAMCSDWQEFRRCFEYLSEWALSLAAQGQSASPTGVPVAITDAMVEKACKRYAFREDGAIFPDAYSADEVRAERQLMREFLEHALSASPAGVPDGMVLVPREPNGEMLDAAIDAYEGFAGEDEVDAVWSAMLATAPSAPKSDGGAE